MKKRYRLKVVLISAAFVLCAALTAGFIYYESNNVITFQHAVGLTPSQIAKVGIKSTRSVPGGVELVTTDPERINAIYNELKGEKLDKNWNPKPLAGWPYSINFYPKQGKGWINFTITPSITFNKYEGYTGPGVQGSYVLENRDQVYQILRSFYISLGGKVVE